MRARRFHPLPTVAAALLLATPLALAPTGALAQDTDTTDLTVTYAESTRWNTGYSGLITLHNASDTPVEDWEITFELPDDSRIHELWNASVTDDEGAYSITPPHWGAAVPAGGSYSFGFNGLHEDGSTEPVDCAVNGSPCSGEEPSTGPDHEHLSIAYFTQWGVEERGYRVRDIVDDGSADQLTHINYAFGNIDEDGRCFLSDEPEEGDAEADYWGLVDAEDSVDGVADHPDQELRGNFHQLAKLKEQYPHLNTNISLGGWSWSRNFSDAALTPESREELVSSCIDLYLRGNLPQIDGAGGQGAAEGVFDGIDLDWEWPGSDGHPDNVVREEDKENYTALVQEFRDQLDALGEETGEYYELTAFLPATGSKLDLGFELDDLMPNFDFVTVQGYDYHGTWEENTNLHSNLTVHPDDPGPELSSEDVLRAYLERGVDPAQLVLGVPFYSQGWTGVEPGPNGDGLFQLAEGPAEGIHAPGAENWRDLDPEGFELHRSDTMGAAWLYDGETFWTYDDDVATSQKSTWAVENGLAGVMAWSIDGDDGTLMSAIDSALSQ